ncbi:diaminohydroxyphosphoribosylaminopyrimidine deaminase [Balnearium lithotrophicum]|uniref:Riboflavin biosynthesis protein RibD n=1 Tax=Balnearium lithotrophicum TaxID=223788 RepID=A0A521BS68_9BACT|nr:bifunctional diaminohydroxyphosphoribosylaminopyrimidine deaminase/5-amino-6-(5-phosphoribosylamino)uracil reductase RibD [Balnearium lithotrophicum]SMO49581.1 diaminohydroxyphosphoribosylaminopyrimidine deaminase [Balnearium lithotrophicum]
MDRITLEDIKFMNLALREAYRAKGKTLPNPAVGAVVVKDGRVISTGYHKRAGLPHAEVVALERAGDRARGARIYVTLEPCNHYGRTPPCTEKIIRSGVKEVVIGVRDPNPEASGGVERLKGAGIEVKVGVLKKRCLELIDDFTVNVLKNRAFLNLKIASTLDGRIADRNGNSKWITNEASRRYVQRLRSYHNGVMVGIGTVLKDNPKLTVRDFPVERQPFAVVVDRELRIPTNCYLVKERAKELIVVTSQESLLTYKAGILKDLGVRLLPVFDLGDNLDLKEALEKLKSEVGIYSVLCEGGSRLAYSLLSENLVDKLTLFYSPKIVGNEGVPMFGGNVGELPQEEKFKLIRSSRFYSDTLLVFIDRELYYKGLQT